MLPSHPNEFQPDWLAEKLGQPAGSLAGWMSAPIGTGQVGDSYRLNLDWKSDSASVSGTRPATIVSKCPAADPTSRQAGRDMRIYDCEVLWYSQFAPKIGIRVPYCYYTAIDDDLEHFVLLMEDVSPAQQGNQTLGGTRKQVRQALREAAILHASHWGNATTAAMDWPNKDTSGRLDVLPAIYPMWRERYEGRLAKDVLDLGEELAQNIAKLQQEIPSEPQGLQHGDLRLDNILYSDSNGRAIIVDWQTFTWGSPLADVSYCIGTSFADPQERAGCEEALVSEYLGKLKEQGVTCDAELAWRIYRSRAFGGFLMGIFAAMFVERTQRGDEMFAAMAERSALQAMHLDTLNLF